MVKIQDMLQIQFGLIRKGNIVNGLDGLTESASVLGEVQLPSLSGHVSPA